MLDSKCECATIFVADGMIHEEVSRLVENFETRWDIRVDRPSPEDGAVIYGTPSKGDLREGVTIYFPRSTMVEKSTGWNSVTLGERRRDYFSSLRRRVPPMQRLSLKTAVF